VKKAISELPQLNSDMNEPDLVPFNIVDESELLRPEFDIPMLITKTSTSSAAAEISPSKR
jgi:hypothetical protein